MILDLIVIVVVLISAALAMVRGFVREVLSVASWLAAAGAAVLLYKPLVPMVKPYIENPTYASIVAAAAIFFVALIVASYITTKISDYVIDSRVGALDRGLGFLFGAARGLLLLVIALAFFNWLVTKPQAWVENSRSGPLLANLGERLRDALPADLEQKLSDFAKSRGSEPAGGEATPPGEDAPAAAPGATYGTGTRQNLENLIQNSDN